MPTAYAPAAGYAIMEELVNRFVPDYFMVPQPPHGMLLKVCGMDGVETGWAMTVEQGYRLIAQLQADLRVTQVISATY